MTTPTFDPKHTSPRSPSAGHTGEQPARETPLRRRAVACAVVLILYLAFLLWIRSWWGLVAVPFIFDAYITKFIPWTWWKKSKNPALRTLMGWVDAIIFALVAVYFVNIYFFQNYQIPTSSLEKSLLVGDYLFVSKMSYGPRVPNTPLSMPLTQHTLPVLGCKSYLDRPQWPYKRVAGFGTPQRGDIVVFNFPAGDTVALGFQQMDIYSLAYEVGRQISGDLVQINPDSLSPEERHTYYSLLYTSGMNFIRSNPQTYGEVVYRPVDRRENYVKRCIALPGDELEIREGEVYINGTRQKMPAEAQFTYFVWTEGPLNEEILRDLHISREDAAHYDAELSVYVLPLTAESAARLQQMAPLVKRMTRLTDREDGGNVYPLNMNSHWGRDNYGPIRIPKKGETLPLTLETLPLYERAIAAYEGNRLEVRDGRILINGKEARSYTFRMDYYWMMGDNRHNSLDSRYWGFVPEDHIVGKPIVVWLSLDKDRGWLDGRIRWDRLFKWVDNIR